MWRDLFLLFENLNKIQKKTKRNVAGNEQIQKPAPQLIIGKKDIVRKEKAL